MSLAFIPYAQAQIPWIFGAVLLTFALVALVLFAFIPRTIRITGNMLRIASPIHTWSIPLADILHAEPATLNPWTTIRLFAIGWPLPTNGLLWSRAYGRFQAHAGSRRDLYMLTLRDGSKVLVSLHDPALRAGLASLAAVHQ